MEIDEMLAALASRGMDLVRHCHQVNQDHARAADVLVERFSITRVVAGRWSRLAKALFGPLTDPVSARARAQSIAYAEQLGMSIDALLAINLSLRYLEPKAPLSREEVRAELTVKAEGLSVDNIKAVASARVRELNEGVETTPAPTRRYFRTSRTADPRGMRYGHLCLPEADMAALERMLHERAQKLRKSNTGLTHQQAMADALTNHGGANVNDSHWLQPAILITMDDLKGKGDGTYATTDGTLITPREYANQQLAPYGLCLVYDDKAEPVDLYRVKRIANDKQRAIINLDQILCADPHCTHTAATSQVHHIKPWAKGGKTELPNLAGACSPHNARNDDDPLTRRNGRIERCPTTGRVGWRPPDGGPLQFNRYPIMAKSGRAWALSQIAKRSLPPNKRREAPSQQG